MQFINTHKVFRQFKIDKTEDSLRDIYSRVNKLNELENRSWIKLWPTFIINIHGTW